MSRASRRRSRSPRRTNLEDIEKTFDNASFCLADVRDFTRFQEFIPSVCTDRRVRTLFNFHNTLRDSRQKKRYKGVTHMMDAMLLRYMHYLLFKYSPGIYYPMQMNVWKSSRNPIELEVIHGDGNQEKFDIEHGLKLIRGIVDETNSPYALLILIFEEQGQHQTMIVVYKNNDGAIGFSWLDTEKSIRADIRKLIHGTLARANIVTHGHTPLAINCRSLPEDYPEVLQSCRDVAVPRAACLLQLSMDSYAQTLQEHVEVMDRVEEMRRKHDDLERGRDLKYAQRLAEDAVEIMNTVNFTSKDLHEEKYARLLPSRILPPPPPNRKKK